MDEWTIDESQLEQDSRFPSGPWLGFFLDSRNSRRNWMDLSLTFKDGIITGAGRDYVGKFGIAGAYNVDEGKCHLRKTYIGRHSVMYEGYNEGRGVWGVWNIAEDNLRGGFHIWPESMGDLSGETLYEEVEVPVDEEVGLLIGADADDVTIGTSR